MAGVALTTLAAQLATLLERIDAVERKLDAATGGGKLTRAFLSKQQDKNLREQAALRAELRSHAAALTRLDSSVQGLTGECRAQRERRQVQDHLWRNLEDRVGALEEG